MKHEWKGWKASGTTDKVSTPLHSGDLRGRFGIRSDGIGNECHGAVLSIIGFQFLDGLGIVIW